MRRREFIAGLGTAATWPMVAQAQQPVVPVIGWLNNPAPGTMERFLPAFKEGLADTGYVVGRNAAIVFREGGADQLQALAADLVRQKVTVIVAIGNTSAQAARAATQTIPVVFAIVGDPVELGIVASLSRPSGNITGFTSVGSELFGKRLELLHKLVPAADPIAYVSRTVPVSDTDRTMQTAARVLGVRLLPFVAATGSEIAAAFATIVEQRAGALLGPLDALSPSAVDQIISLAGRYAVPTLFFTREGVVRGGLASYGTDLADGMRQVGVYAGKILNGTKPADLPVQQPTKFELVINLKTAKALGLTIPETLLATADEVIQ
jgi:putative ABC transport system substrate-binding protein